MERVKLINLKGVIIGFNGLRKDTVWYLEEELIRRKIVLMMEGKLFRSFIKI